MNVMIAPHTFRPKYKVGDRVRTRRSRRINSRLTIRHGRVGVVVEVYNNITVRRTFYYVRFRGLYGDYRFRSDYLGKVASDD